MASICDRTAAASAVVRVAKSFSRSRSVSLAPGRHAPTLPSPFPFFFAADRPFPGTRLGSDEAGWNPLAEVIDKNRGEAVVLLHRGAAQRSQGVEHVSRRRQADDLHRSHHLPAGSGRDR